MPDNTPSENKRGMNEENVLSGITDALSVKLSKMSKCQFNPFKTRLFTYKDKSVCDFSSLTTFLETILSYKNIIFLS